MTSSELTDGQQHGSWMRRLLDVLLPWRSAAAIRQARDEAQKLHVSNTELERLQERLLKQRTVALKSMATTRKQLAEVQNDLNAQSARLRLVAAAMTPDIANTERLRQFNSVFGEELLPFLKTIDLLGDAADLVTRLRAVQDRLRVLESLEDFAGKSIVAVAGGFSSGKSSFLSSLFDRDELHLPIGIQPMTAIPTYVFHGNREFIRAYSNRGGTVAMDEATYGGLCHDQIREFGFNLRDLLPFIAIETSISRYSNLAFIDLPGHDPGQRDGHTGGDESAASEFLSQARHVLWLIGLDASGTLNRSSIDYLLDHAPPDAELYVVLNKADLRPQNALEEILDEVQDQLMVAGLPCAGLSAYSSELQQELTWRHAQLHDTLARWNEPVPTLSRLRIELEAVFDRYESALRRDIEDRKDKIRSLKSLEIDLIAAGTFEEEGRVPDFDAVEFTKRRRKRSKSGGDEEGDEKSGGKQDSKPRKKEGLQARINDMLGGYSMRSINTRLPRSPSGADEEDKNKKKKPSGKQNRKPPKKGELVSQSQQANGISTNHNALLESIRQHLGDLRKAHSVKEREEQLDTLIRLRSQLLKTLE